MTFLSVPEASSPGTLSTSWGMSPRDKTVYSIEKNGHKPCRVYPTPEAKWTKAVSSDTVEIDDQRPCQEVFRVFSSCLGQLKLCGVWRGRFTTCAEGLPNAHSRYKWSQRVTAWSITLLSLLHFYLVMSFLSVFFAIGTKELWATVAVFIRTGTSVLTIDLFFVNEPEIAQLLCDFSKYPITDERLKTVRRTCLVSTVLGGLYTLLRILIDFRSILASKYGYHDYQVRHWCGITLEPWDRQSVAIMLCVDVLFKTPLITASAIYIVVFYLTMVSYEKHLFACYNLIVQRRVGESQGSNKLTMSLIELQAVRRLQSNLSKTVLKSDDLFQKTAFFWTGLFVIGVCLEVTRYYGGKASDPDFDGPNELLQLFINLMYFFTLFMSLSIFGAKLTETAHACTMLVHRMINHAPTQENLELFSQAHLLVAQMNKPEIAMSGWNFFTFSRNFILTIGGALLSYIIIIIQMAPSNTSAKGEDGAATASTNITTMADIYNVTMSSYLGNITTIGGDE